MVRPNPHWVPKVSAYEAHVARLNAIERRGALTTWTADSVMANLKVMMAEQERLMRARLDLDKGRD